MTLGRVIDAVVAQLTGALPAGVAVGDRGPSAVADLPLVALSIDQAEHQLIGIGAIPRGTLHGALPVELDVDLADPVVPLGGGDVLQLLSADRRVLTLPNGPVVRADGTDDVPFEPGDVVVTDPDPFAVVAAAPNGREVRVDPVEGSLEFGEALATTGQLHVRYHLGQWDVVTTRSQGGLVVEVVAADADGAAQLARQVAAALEVPRGDLRLAPTSWGAAHALEVGDDAARRQVLGYRFDAEIEDPLVGTSGGVIGVVRVAVDLPDPADASPDETFDVG